MTKHWGTMVTHCLVGLQTCINHHKKVHPVCSKVELCKGYEELHRMDMSAMRTLSLWCLPVRVGSGSMCSFGKHKLCA